MREQREPRPGRPEAAAIVWNWREPGPTTAAPPEAARLRLRGALQGMIGLGVGALVLGFVSRPLGLFIVGVASLILLAALLSPTGLFAAIDRGMLALGRGVGQAISWLTLPLVFYLFFVPFGLSFRRGRRDSMKRFYEPSASSYWSDRTQGIVASASRSRQF